MSKQKAVLSRLARDLSARRPIDIEACFTPDFCLHDPGAPNWPPGYEGARTMLAGILDFAPDLAIDIVDAVEEADRVAVRWRVVGTREGKRTEAAIVAIYRFAADRRIAEDWGVAARAPWP